MKPAKFDYYKPNTLNEALSLLEELGENGKIIAGGQSLVPIMNMRLATPEALIDINNLEDLHYIKKEDSMIKIGALTRQRIVETSDIIRENCGLLADSIPHIGHVQTRNRGTIGGSLVHADPTAELPLALLALKGTLHISSSDEVRVVEAEDFFITYLTTDMMPNEILTEIQIPIMEGRVGYAFAEIARRHGDFGIVAAACVMTIDDNENLESIRLTLGGVEAIPLLVEEAEEILKGEKVTDSLLEQITEAVVDVIDPESDLHASAEYRTHLAKILTKRVINEAYSKAKGVI
ncbi:FAD binding domain-containing protein [Halalkalibacter nanhaiisediminis]|uniref:Carbon-monoxide dehydrogenase medium subunit/2-furoyl-CoA dehydrogenase FAD binding subunit n=1 Tax=Halalkalibacter nanhaiisediminis TaxID=688079 RepID=A0A562QN83_9BACI|nr:xanthine dehydrogenase family protein subunit M [Halalkalibacter nanhaiisediminis]TWI58155.1 carbon-monoxide dehydrogenase medium subunit/2-furoyl-CoA dehydrogenase FAD binding subunit [Halalkalibacter nanhaiisediminis]